MKKILTALALVLSFGMFQQSHATVIDFDSGIPTGEFTGIFTEDGFDLNFSDSMFGATGSTSTPSIEIERRFGTAGTLTITRSGGGLFTFNSIDWQSESSTLVDIVLDAFIGAALVGSDTFSTSSPNYTTFGPGALSGIQLDRLVISADRSSGRLGAFDTVVLSEVPEPATLALMGLGLAGIGWRKRKSC